MTNSTSAYERLPTSSDDLDVADPLYPPTPVPAGPSRPHGQGYRHHHKSTASRWISWAFSPSSDRAFTYSQPSANNEPGHGPPYPLHIYKPSQSPLIVIIKYLAGATFGLVILHYVLLGAFPNSPYSTGFNSKSKSGIYYGTDAAGSSSISNYGEAQAAAAELLDRIHPSAGQPGTFFRDSYPLKSMLAFWELAEKEVAARGLDTCNGQLSGPLVDAYHEAEMTYCAPPGHVEAGGNFELVPTDHNGSYSHSHWKPGDSPVPGTAISCSPVHRSLFSRWWPYPAAPCISTNLRTIPGDERKFRAAGCEMTEEGKKLKGEMGNERFLGSDVDHIPLISGDGDESGKNEAECTERIERTLLVIGRQDQWNPFHVAEDLITTLVSSFIALRTAPELLDTRVQLVFVEGYGMDSNHFTALWDRMGAWAPRRLSLDPWKKGTCLTNTIHSVGAGASLLSAMGVGKPYSCASTITWAAAHYYRHLFGLLPPSLARAQQESVSPDDASPAALAAVEAEPDIARRRSGPPSAPSALANLIKRQRPRNPINILWLSRAKLDDYAQKHNDWSNWRDVRHITNEPELIDKLRTGLSEMCKGGNGVKEFGPGGCVFEDAQEVPESWDLISPLTSEDAEDGPEGGDQPIPIRFATIDPTVHALETQIHYVGHSTILVSSHGGALGLSLFLPPGGGTILELQVENVQGNYHFQHMAYEMGHQYEVLKIERNVDTEQVWESVRRWVWKRAQAAD
ncbi:hypothetical protein I317_03638 [Kwoniella heveanensis CBS 569]|nr:hypothetical protein I317_03638 [Kwoniella heveanensis CBS 569]